MCKGGFNVELLSFVTETFLIVIPTLYVVGIFIKNTDFLKDELIPLLLMVLGVVFCSGLAQTIDTNSIIQGILCAGVAVLGNQTIKQIEKITER